jgi:hypothetical protein
MDWVRLGAGARQHWVFGVALAGAVVVRVLVLLAFRPIMWFGGDSASYLATGLHLIPDPSRVGGYGFMWWLLRSATLVAVVQHVMGLGIGVLSYLLARRYGLPGWAATLAAVPVLFDAYELQLESDAVPDIPFGLLVFIALYLLLRTPGERRPARIGAAAFVLGVTAIIWPVGLALLAVLVVALVIRRAGVLVVAAAILAGAVPVAGYAAWFDLHEHQFGLTRSEGVYLWSRTMSFANCAVIKPPADERVLCPPAAGTREPRMAASLYIWDGGSPLLRLPGGRFSARTNALTRNFALRAIAAQPGGYLTAVGHDIALSFFWDRPVHPDAGIVDRYQFADAATAWVPAQMGAIGGGTVAGDQAAYNGGHPAATRAVQPFAGWLVSYQRFVYLRGTLLGVILLGGGVLMIVRRWRGRRDRGGWGGGGRLGGEVGWAFGLAWGFAAATLVVPPMIADFDLRYLVPAVPAACLAAALAFAPRPGQAGSVGPSGQRRCTTSPAATGTSESGDTRTTSLPSGSTPAASPESS